MELPLTINNAILVKVFGLDDDDSIILKLASGLDKAGIPNYEMFVDHETFFEKFDTHVHIAIVDHRLSGPQTGFDVMKKLLEINPACLVIVMSGQTDAKLIINYYNHGAFRFIIKNEDDFVEQVLEGVSTAFHKIKSILMFYKDQIERLTLIKQVYAKN